MVKKQMVLQFISDLRSKARVERAKQRDAQTRAELLEEQACLLELELDKACWHQVPENKQP